jgi:hypothetical protein
MRKKPKRAVFITFIVLGLIAAVVGVTLPGELLGAGSHVYGFPLFFNGLLIAIFNAFLLVISEKVQP